MSSNQTNFKSHLSRERKRDGIRSATKGRERGAVEPSIASALESVGCVRWVGLCKGARPPAQLIVIQSRCFHSLDPCPGPALQFPLWSGLSTIPTPCAQGYQAPHPDFICHVRCWTILNFCS
jgi:hypothetical protein